MEKKGQIKQNILHEFIFTRKIEFEFIFIPERINLCLAIPYIPSLFEYLIENTVVPMVHEYSLFSEHLNNKPP